MPVSLCPPPYNYIVTSTAIPTKIPTYTDPVISMQPSVQDTEKRQTVVHELSHFDFVGAQMKDESAGGSELGLAI